MKKIFDKTIYHKRNLIETVNFVKKQKFGSVIRSRKRLMQRKEGLLIDIVYNLYRHIRINCYIVIGFLQSHYINNNILYFYMKDKIILLIKNPIYVFLSIPMRLIYYYINFSKEKFRKKTLKNNNNKNLIKKYIIDIKKYMYLDLFDTGLSLELLYDGRREILATETYKNLLRKNDIILDIGANIGYFAILGAGLSKKVYAVEPVQESINILKKNIETNNLKNIELFQMAFGNKISNIPIYIYSSRNLSSIKKNNKNPLKIINIEMNTVDEFLRNKDLPTVIRMDVEGYESEIFEGMKKTLKNKKIRLIFLELHFSIIRNQAIKLLKLLKDNGFELYKGFNENKYSLHHKKLSKLLSKLEYLRRGKKQYLSIHNEMGLSINDIIENEDILIGLYSKSPEMFFIRKNKFFIPL